MVITVDDSLDLTLTVQNNSIVLATKIASIEQISKDTLICLLDESMETGDVIRDICPIQFATDKVEGNLLLVSRRELVKDNDDFYKLLNAYISQYFYWKERIAILNSNCSSNEESKISNSYFEINFQNPDNNIFLFC